MSSRLRELLSGPIARGSIGSLGMLINSVFLALITSIFLARMLGASGFGAYGFAQAVIEILLVPATLGIPTLLIREFPASLKSEDSAYINHLLRQSLNLVFAFSGLLAIVGCFLTILVGSKLEKGMAEPLIIALFMLPLLTVCFTWEAGLRGLGRTVASQIPLNVLKPGVVLVIILVVFWSSIPLDATSAIWINLFATLLALALFLKIWWRYRPQHEEQQSERPMTLFRLVKVGLPFALIAGFGALNNQADIVMLGFMSGAEDTGLYRVAHKLAVTTIFPLMALLMPLGPVQAGLYAGGDLETMQHRSAIATRYAFSGALLISAVLVVFNRFFLGLFGQEFITADNALLILCLGNIMSALVMTTQLTLSMCGHEKLVATNLAWGAGFNVALNIFLIPWFGIEGAAVASVLSTLLLGILLIRSSKRALGFQPSLLGFRRTK